jgi:hypothetical protein
MGFDQSHELAWTAIVLMLLAALFLIMGDAEES